ncbi:MAG: hypothetical protein LBS34_00955 [Rickettsiales bacterium]|jgi:hypothetical protein|nr:hypothetical protein [Rickettsiales bacterium]
MYKIDKDGIKIPTLNELLEVKTQEFRDIYGEDINVEQNAPDGQLINIEATKVKKTGSEFHIDNCELNPRMGPKQFLLTKEWTRWVISVPRN